MLTRFVIALLFLLITNSSNAFHPLSSLDTSSPRATMNSFRVATEDLAHRLIEYRESPSSTTQDALWQSGERAVQLLDLSQMAPAARKELGFESYLLLWEVIARIELPPLHEIPDESAFAKGDDEGKKRALWRIPNTDITIARVEEGERNGEFLFSPNTVASVQSFFNLTENLPYLRPIPVEHLAWTEQNLTGWMIPMTWVELLPGWLTISILGQVLWKWLVLLLVYGIAIVAVIWMFRWSHRKSSNNTLHSFFYRLSSPLAILILAPLIQYFANIQINVSGYAAAVPDNLSEIALGLGIVWVLWIAATWIAETIIAAPQISSESLDAHLIRLAARSIGIVAFIWLVFRIAHDIGIPVYGLVAGAGISGLAVALAAKNTLENFIGALNLFADRPIRVGDLCRYDDESNPEWSPIGRVESIGLRSTKIRRFDRGLITTPNAELAQRNIVNLSACDRFLLSNTIGLRYETTDDQLRFMLVELRELLHAHPKTIHTIEDPIRVRFSGFGNYTLNISIRAYIQTTAYNEFLAIQEDIFLRVMKIVEQAGSDFAFPSHTLYHNRDSGLDTKQQQTAERKVREWASAHTLPFPDFSDAYRSKITDTLDYPPEGSPDADSS